MIISQKEFKAYLDNNPLGTEVWIGDLEDLNGKDYIFLNYTDQELIGSDNKGVYQTHYEIVIATKDFDDRLTLTNYIQQFLNVSVDFSKSDEFEYYLATLEGGLFLYEVD